MRAGAVDAHGTVWLRVGKESGAPCPICGKRDYCTVTDDGTAACCMRVESDKPMRNGGFLHRLRELDPSPRRPVERPRRAEPEPERPDFEALWQRMRFVATESRVCAFAAGLGVSRHSLDRLGASWANRARAWAFPMRDVDGTVIGIRLRAEDGRKWAITGSRAGLFCDPVSLGDLVTQIVIAEGPTDTAALLDLGYQAVGRPSCRGAHDLVAPLAAGRDVVICSDVDTPGRMGARDLARALWTWPRQRPRSLRIIEPLTGKDVRDWVQAGATREVVDAVIRNTGYWHG